MAAFPSLYGNLSKENIEVEINKFIFDPITEESAEFCDLLGNGIIKINPFARGGFGEVGDLLIDEDQINQKIYGIIISIKRSLYYKSYQNWLDQSNISKSKDGNPIEVVNLNIIFMNDWTGVELNHGGDLWNNARVDFDGIKSGVAINAGYFLCPCNLITGINDTIINDDDVMNRRPIGYYYYHRRTDDNNGTFLPIPKPYRPYFGVVWCDNDNNINIWKYQDFLEKHERYSEDITYILEDGNIYKTIQEVIMMQRNNGNKDTKGLHPSNFKHDKMPYKWAFCTGPMLVWDGEIVFNSELMLNKQFQIDDTDIPFGSFVKPPNFTRYKLSDTDDYYMFKTSILKGKEFTGYGSRHSNRFMIHNVLGIDERGMLISVLVEGRGYNAPGLDRVQVAHLMKNFKFSYAISLDGGFSANAVYKIDNGKRMYLQNDPEKRDLGTSISFTFN